ncbi:MAG TPA: nickel pincer cofactor biosynthesis protein LarB [Longimicrobiales bacterium]|nr:nickel pincer cofactor biosynthesis protein LarB [Longimicrobiales bacterium]
MAALLEAVADGRVDPGAALRELAWQPVEALDGDGGVFARVDHHRALRQGQAEVVFGQGKTSAQIVEICRALERKGRGFLVTRLAPEAMHAVERAFPEAVLGTRGRVAYLPPERPSPPSHDHPIAVFSAGTADEPVVEEILFTCRAFGDPVRDVRDVGVAGLHRIVSVRDAFDGASVAVVVAGMEGALPSVVGGLVDLPVIGVPTSVGYGAALGGLTPLLAMLTSCASGVTVVNIDNGFGAAAAASRIRRQVLRVQTSEPPARVEALASEPAP